MRLVTTTSLLQLAPALHSFRRAEGTYPVFRSPKQATYVGPVRHDNAQCNRNPENKQARIDPLDVEYVSPNGHHGRKRRRRLQGRHGNVSGRNQHDQENSQRNPHGGGRQGEQYARRSIDALPSPKTGPYGIHMSENRRHARKKPHDHFHLPDGEARRKHIQSKRCDHARGQQPFPQVHQRSQYAGFPAKHPENVRRACVAAPVQANVYAVHPLAYPDAARYGTDQVTQYQDNGERQHDAKRAESYFRVYLNTPGGPSCFRKIAGSHACSGK